MIHDAYLKFHREMCDRMCAITAAKNHDYAGGQNHAFANFTMVELVGIASTEQGFLTRITDKFTRIINFCNSGILKVADEKIEDTCLDAANYFILLAGYIKSKKANGDG